MSIFGWLTGRRHPDGPVLGGITLGPRPWLVLGGGGLRGPAHIGALRVLQDRGFAPAGVIGTSIGALVGACLAGGQTTAEMEEAARAATKERVAEMPPRVLWARGILSPSLYRGDVLRGFLEEVLPSGGWEALELRFQANAVELGTGRTEWFGIGGRTDASLVDAVYASMALPLFYPPAGLPGGLYVDGGTEDALPIRRAEGLGATSVVAVDVGSGATADAESVVERGMLAIHERVFSIMSGRRRRATVEGWDGPPLLYVRPDVEDIGTLDFDRVDDAIAAGERAMTAALEAGRE